MRVPTQRGLCEIKWAACAGLQRASTGERIGVQTSEGGPLERRLQVMPERAPCGGRGGLCKQGGPGLLPGGPQRPCLTVQHQGLPGSAPTPQCAFPKPLTPGPRWLGHRLQPWKWGRREPWDPQGTMLVRVERGGGTGPGSGQSSDGLRVVLHSCGDPEAAAGPSPRDAAESPSGVDSRGRGGGWGEG